VKKRTDELESEIKDTKDIEKYIRDNAGEFNGGMFLRTLKEHYANSGLTQEAIANRSMLSHGYVNNILQNIKRPSRDTIVKLAFGLSLNVDDTNRLLKLAGHGELYPRLERDAVILFCLNKGVNLIEANELLQQRLESVLASEK
jgi:transcriptional regulator with XRE-family HTH domain